MITILHAESSLGWGGRREGPCGNCWVFAFPLLRKYGIKATIFVITSWTVEGKERSLWNPEGPPGAELPPSSATERSRRKPPRGMEAWR